MDSFFFCWGNFHGFLDRYVFSTRFRQGCENQSDVLPNSLNGYLNENEGYNYRGWLRWSKCLEPTNGRVVVSYLGDPDHKRLDDYLSREIPSIVKVFIGGVIPHWVVVVGKQGEEYIINDPLNSQGSQRYLSYYGEKVYSMRVFEKALSK